MTGEHTGESDIFYQTVAPNRGNLNRRFSNLFSQRNPCHSNQVFSSLHSAIDQQGHLSGQNYDTFQSKENTDKKSHDLSSENHISVGNTAKSIRSFVASDFQAKKFFRSLTDQPRQSGVSKDDLDVCVEAIREENRLENLSSGEDDFLEDTKSEKVTTPEPNRVGEK